MPAPTRRAHVGRPPHYANAFVGRTDEIERLARWLTSSRQLITVVGTAGIGKTRLAAELTRRVLASPGASEGIAIFVALGSARSASQMCALVAHALGVPLQERGADDMVEQLDDAFERRRAVLVVLDEFEQLLSSPEAASLVSQWVEGSPETTFVVTSREPLRVAEEHVFRLSALDLPTPEAPGAAILLLRKRLSAMGASMRIAEDEEREIVRRLDGIPLAIELAAARMVAFGPHALTLQGGSSLDVLTYLPRLSPGRGTGQTLREALDRSWALLSVQERKALGVLSILPGSFDLETATHLLSDEPVDVVQTLHDKSLVRSEDVGPAPRWSLFTSVREYASEQSGPDQLATSRFRMVSYFADLAFSAAAEVSTARGRGGLERLVADRDNCLAAVEFARAEASSDDAMAACFVCLAVALEPLFWAWGPLGTHLELLEHAMTFERIPPELRARALLSRGEARRLAGRMSDCADDHLRARAIARTHGWKELEAAIVASTARAYFSQGKFKEAEESAVFASAPGLADTTRGWALIFLAAVHAEAARDAESVACGEEALTCLARAGDMRGEAVAVILRGVFYLDRGRYELSRSFFEASIAVYDRLGVVGRDYVALCNFALIDHCLGNFDASFVAYERAIHRAREIGHSTAEAASLGYWGVALLEQGDLRGARGRLKAACLLYEHVHDRRYGALFGAYQAAVCALLGETALAAKLVGDARHLHGGQTEVVSLSAALVIELAESLLLEPLDAGEFKKGAMRTRLAAASQGSSYHLFLATRTAQSILGRNEAFSPDSAPRASERALSIHARGEWFEILGQRVRIQRGGALRRLLARLAVARRDQPGVSVAPEDLIGAAWPGETFVGASAGGRLRTSVWRLRKLGLDAYLLSSDEGYRFTTDVAIRLFDVDS